jgi:leader peptidase (prepilin peptidase)/N-methyltransferase
MLLLIIFGGVLASFLFAATSMTHISFLTRRSQCDHCSHKLSWYELIPVVSFLCLRGRCLKCTHRIPLSYLVVEVVTIILFITPVVLEISIYNLTLYYLIVSILIPLSLYDFEMLKIPNHMSLVFLFSGLYLTGLQYIEFMYDGIVIVVLHLLYFLFKDSIGYGDIKLFTVLTLITPIDFFLYTVLFTYFVGGSFVVFIQLFKNEELKKVPLVPFITNAIIIVFFFYEEINIIYYGGFL